MNNIFTKLRMSPFTGWSMLFVLCLLASVPIICFTEKYHYEKVDAQILAIEKTRRYSQTFVKDSHGHSNWVRGILGGIGDNVTLSCKQGVRYFKDCVVVK